MTVPAGGPTDSGKRGTAEGIAAIALVMRIEAEAESAVGVILGVARSVKNPEAAANDPFIAR